MTVSIDRSTVEIMATWQIQVALHDDADIDQVAASAEKAGLLVQQKLTTLGLLIGEVDEDKVKSLEAVPGVASVERTREIAVAPHDSGVQ